MKVIKPQKLGVLSRTFEHRGRCHFTISPIVFFAFDAPHALLSEISMWKFLAAELGTEGAVDESMPKPYAEVLVNGSAYPVHPPQAACTVRVQIGTVDKTLRVVGDRHWEHGTPSAPSRFTSIPLAWDRAFGGEGFAHNPLGRGAPKPNHSANSPQPLPNIEDPAHLVSSPKDRPAPAGFGPYDFTWPQRFEKAGTYDQTWLETRFPGLADDVDITMFNAAPKDQWLEHYFRGDETFVLEHMHPSRPRIEGRLPGVATRVFVTARARGGEQFLEVQTRLDTVRFFPHAERGVLIFRGVVEVAEDDADDVLQLIVACEDLGAPRPVEHYQQVLQQRMDRAKGHLYALRDRDLMPPPHADDAQAPDERDPLLDAVQSEGLVRQGLRRRAMHEREKLAERVRAAGLDPATIVPPLPDEPAPPDMENLDVVVESAQSQIEQGRAAMEQRKAIIDEQMRQAAAAQGLDVEKLRASAGGPPRFSASDQMAVLHALALEARNAGIQAPDLEATLADPMTERRLQETERKIRESYMRFAHQFPAAARRDADQSAVARDVVQRALAQGESLAGRDFTGVDFTGLDLTGADLRGALMERTVLCYCDLAAANLSGAVLARADLRNARLHGTNLENANLGEAIVSQTWLGGSVSLRGATLHRADFTESNLAGADLSGADCFGAVFKNANLTNLRAPRAVFYQTDLTGVAFGGADLEHATLIEARLAGADFTSSKLTSAVFVSVNGDGATFREAVLHNLRVVKDCSFERANFHGATLEAATLRDTKLSECDFSNVRADRCDFSGCTLTRANFHAASLRETRFVRAALRGAIFTSADLMEANLQKARIQGADLTGASLFRADMALVRGDSHTRLDGANVKHTRIVIRSPHEPR